MARRKGGRKRAALSGAIREAHHSRPVARTKRKFGKARAHKQAIAIGFAKMGMSRSRKKSGGRRRKGKR